LDPELVDCCGGAIPVALAVAFLLGDALTTNELEDATVVEVEVGEKDCELNPVGVPDEIAVPILADAELPPADTAGPTSGCLPESGVVLNPQFEPAVLRVFPYIRQML